MKVQPKKQSESQASVIARVIRENVPEDYTGHSRAQAIGIALKAYYEHQSVLAKCRAVNALAKQLSRQIDFLEESK